MGETERRKALLSASPKGPWTATSESNWALMHPAGRLTEVAALPVRNGPEVVLNTCPGAVFCVARVGSRWESPECQ